MNSSLSDDRSRLPELLTAAAAYAAAMAADLDVRPAAVVPPGLDLPALAVDGVGAQGALDYFVRRVAPYLSGSAGPRHLGFVTGGATPAALLGDWFVSLFDQNAVSTLDGAAALQLEQHTAAMLRDLFGLPAEFAGSFVSGATLANFVGLAVGREWAGRRLDIHVSQDGLGAVGRIPVLSGVPHSSAVKALSMLGLGRSAWQPVACRPDREAVDVDALAQALAALDRPAIVVANAGTVNTGDFDDLQAIAALKQRYDFWLHVDAAFGGFASLAPALRPLLDGWTAADSICMDLHKWLNVPYDAGIAFVRRRDLQRDVFANHSAYLGNPDEDPTPIHRVPENSHRWRALPAWFTLTAYGSAGHQEIVERNCRLAQALGERIAASRPFELLAPVRLNIVCFALRQPERSDCFIRAVRDTGVAVVTPTNLRGVPAVRAAFSNWRTQDEDLERVWPALLQAVAACE